MTIANEAAQARTVKSVSNDCGCVVQELSSRVAPAGGHWELKFRYRSPNSTGPISRQIVLRFDESGVEPLLVQIQGRVGYWAQPSPDEITFGEVLPGEEVVKHLQVVTPNANEEFAGDPVVSGLPWVSVRLLGSDKLVNAQSEVTGTSHRFQITFTPPANATAAIHDGDIRFAKALSEGVLRVPCRATVLSQIDVSPRDVFFGLVPPGATKACTVRLRLYDSNLGVKATELGLSNECGSEFRTKLSDGENANEAILTVTVTRSANDRPGIHSGHLTVKAPNGVSVQLPVRAWFEQRVIGR